VPDDIKYCRVHYNNTYLYRTLHTKEIEKKIRKENVGNVSSILKIFNKLTITVHYFFKRMYRYLSAFETEPSKPIPARMQNQVNPIPARIQRFSREGEVKARELGEV
jgi:hypothetical protein